MNTRAVVSVQHTIRTRPLLSQQLCTKVVRALLEAEHRAGDVSVHIVGTTRMRQLNHMYRGVDRPTDVLAFETGEQWGDAEELGDIFLCQPYIIAQAKRFGVSQKEEAIRMLVHGMLHLLGYDHEMEKDAAIMFSKQEDYVTRFL